MGCLNGAELACLLVELETIGEIVGTSVRIADYYAGDK
jgi:hypothetical protein